jgi:hypothetical protein
MHIGFHIASSLARYELLIRSPNFRSWCFGERCNKLDIGIKPNFVKIHNKNIRNSGEEQGSLSQKVFPNQSCGLSPLQEFSLLPTKYFVGIGPIFVGNVAFPTTFPTSRLVGIKLPIPTTFPTKFAGEVLCQRKPEPILKQGESAHYLPTLVGSVFDI